MKSIESNTISRYEIKNSKFITLLFKVNDDFDLNKILDQVKIDYPKASHYCYAYRTKSFQKSSDDKEPSGTAGIPMLNVLLKEDLINVLAITVRYFGGIKLGAGGLVRAYTTSLTNAITTSSICDLEEGYIIELTAPYSSQKQLDYLLQEYNIIEKKYDDIIKYIVEIPKDKLDILNNYEYKINKEDLIKK